MATQHCQTLQQIYCVVCNPFSTSVIHVRRLSARHSLIYKLTTPTYHCMLLRSVPHCPSAEWAKNTGRWAVGDPEPDYGQLKTRLRCALSKASDIEELRDKHRVDIEEPFRVYRFTQHTSSASNSGSLFTRLIKRNLGRQERHQATKMEFNCARPPLNTQTNTSYALCLTGNDVMQDETGYRYIKLPPSYDMHQRERRNQRNSTLAANQRHQTLPNSLYLGTRDALSDRRLVSDSEHHLLTSGFESNHMPIDYTLQGGKCNSGVERRSRGGNGEVSGCQRPKTRNRMASEHLVTSWGKPLNCKHVETLIFDGRKLVRQINVATEVDRQLGDDVMDLSCDRTMGNEKYIGDQSIECSRRSSIDDVLRTLQEDYNRKERLLETKSVLLCEKERQLIVLERILDEKIASVTPFSQSRDLVHRQRDRKSSDRGCEQQRFSPRQSLDYRTTSGSDVIHSNPAACEPPARSIRERLPLHVENLSSLSASCPTEMQPIATGNGNRFVIRNVETGGSSNTSVTSPYLYQVPQPAPTWMTSSAAATFSHGNRELAVVNGIELVVPLSSGPYCDARLVQRDSMNIPRNLYYMLPRRRGRPKGCKTKSPSMQEKLFNHSNNGQLQQITAGGATDEREFLCRPIRTSDGSTMMNIQWSGSSSGSNQLHYVQVSPDVNSAPLKTPRVENLGTIGPSGSVITRAEHARHWSFDGPSDLRMDRRRSSLEYCDSDQRRLAIAADS